jgi:hypothetical protein
VLSDVHTLLSRDANVPDPPEGQRWKAIQHDNKVGRFTTDTTYVLSCCPCSYVSYAAECKNDILFCLGDVAGVLD